MTIHSDSFGVFWGSALQCTMLTEPGPARNLRQGILWEVTGIGVNSRNVSVHKVSTYIALVLFKK